MLLNFLHVVLNLFLSRLDAARGVDSLLVKLAEVEVVPGLLIIFLPIFVTLHAKGLFGWITDQATILFR